MVQKTVDKAGVEKNDKVILLVIGKQLFHIRNRLFCITKYVLVLRGDKPLILHIKTIVEVEEKKEW